MKLIITFLLFFTYGLYGWTDANEKQLSYNGAVIASNDLMIIGDTAKEMFNSLEVQGSGNVGGECLPGNPKPCLIKWGKNYHCFTVRWKKNGALQYRCTIPLNAAKGRAGHKEDCGSNVPDPAKTSARP